MGPDVGTIGYVISCNFRDYLFFSFFTITFISQNIQYTDIISGICFYKKLFKSPKMTDTNKKGHNFSPFFANFVTRENNRIYSIRKAHFSHWHSSILSKFFLQTLSKTEQKSNCRMEILACKDEPLTQYTASPFSQILACYTYL